jgi:YHS domain-containing protein
MDDAPSIDDRLRSDRPGVAIDPVCGMEVVMAGAVNTAEYRGRTWYFCGKGCRLEFQDDPERFLDPGHVPSMG